MTGWCRSCGLSVRVRNTRGAKLSDASCPCGGRLAATITVARALGLPKGESYGVYDAGPDERVRALAALTDGARTG